MALDWVIREKVSYFDNLLDICLVVTFQLSQV